MGIGCGAVGSFTAFALAKMGVGSIKVYDPDRVEIHNLPNQMFAAQDCGLYKAEALRDMVELFHGVEIQIQPECRATHRLKNGRQGGPHNRRRAD
jgi:tRNA A37 threonylcarbamoyladenosine dehydratase